VMRKRPITTTQEPLLAHDERWIDIETTAVVEVSSEEKDFPIDSALLPGEAKGWLAAKPGTQTVRLMFDKPQKLNVLCWFSRRTTYNAVKNLFCDGLRMVDIHYKKLSVSSGISARLTAFERSRSIELNSTGVTVLELIITPEISGGTVRASLKSFHVA